MVGGEDSVDRGNAAAAGNPRRRGKLGANARGNEFSDGCARGVTLWSVADFGREALGEVTRAASSAADTDAGPRDDSKGVAIGTCVRGIVLGGGVVASAQWDLESTGETVGALCGVSAMSGMVIADFVISAAACDPGVAESKSACNGVTVGGQN